MKPGDVVTCVKCGTQATAYTTGDPARWKEGGALMVSWHGTHHEAGVFGGTPSCCLPCAYGEKVRTPAARRDAICSDLAVHGCRYDGFEWNTDQAVEDAYQRWISAGRPRLAFVQVHPPPPSPAAADALERFERDAEAFHRETGMLAPGKDQPAAMNGSPTDEERMDAWTAWLRERAAAAPRPPPKPKGQLALL
jgi:hypothetical protein